MQRQTCASCRGERLRPEYCAVTVGKLPCPAPDELPVAAAHGGRAGLAGKPKLVQSVGAVVEEIRRAWRCSTASGWAT